MSNTDWKSIPTFAPLEGYWAEPMVKDMTVLELRNMIEEIVMRRELSLIDRDEYLRLTSEFDKKIRR